MEYIEKALKFETILKPFIKKSAASIWFENWGSSVLKVQ